MDNLILVDSLNKINESLNEISKNINNLNKDKKYDKLLKENEKLLHNWNMAEDYVKENIRVYENRGYDLVCDIREIPKEEQTDFIHYLAIKIIEKLLETKEISK